MGLSPMISNDSLIMISLVELHGATKRYAPSGRSVQHVAVEARSSLNSKMHKARPNMKEPRPTIGNP